MNLEKINISHTTESEIEFVKKLGEFSTLIKQATRIDLLRKYRAACDARYDWGDMRKEEVIAFVDIEIAALEIGMAA